MTPRFLSVIEGGEKKEKEEGKTLSPGRLPYHLPGLRRGGREKEGSPS